MVPSDLDLPNANGFVHSHIPSGQTGDGCGAAA